MSIISIQRRIIFPTIQIGRKRTTEGYLDTVPEYIKDPSTSFVVLFENGLFLNIRQDKRYDICSATFSWSWTARTISRGYHYSKHTHLCWCARYCECNRKKMKIRILFARSLLHVRLCIKSLLTEPCHPTRISNVRRENRALKGHRSIHG